jgi:hypothetical protein
MPNESSDEMIVKSHIRVAATTIRWDDPYATQTRAPIPSSYHIFEEAHELAQCQISQRQHMKKVQNNSE